MAETSPSKRIPPLAYVIGALIVVCLVVVAVQWRATYHPPDGGLASPETRPLEAPVMPQQPTVQAGPIAPPAPNGAGPTNQPGVLSQPDAQGAPS
jgi:hypothetical protein